MQSIASITIKPRIAQQHCASCQSTPTSTRRHVVYKNYNFQSLSKKIDLALGSPPGWASYFSYVISCKSKIHLELLNCWVEFRGCSPLPSRHSSSSPPGPVAHCFEFLRHSKISSHSHCFVDEVHTQINCNFWGIMRYLPVGNRRHHYKPAIQKIALRIRRTRDMGAFRHVLLHMLVCVCTICIWRQLCLWFVIWRKYCGQKWVSNS